jgi:MFS transporter, DHA3 family, multidrug efflux protein
VTETAPALDLRTGPQRTFLHLLLSTLVVSVINFTVWFALTFWVYLETRSVFATGLIAGIFLVSIAGTGIWFGSLVDHHSKKTVMQWSAAVSSVLYAGSLALYLTVPESTFRNPASVRLWVFVVLLMLGVVTGNLRTIAMPTLVTLLIPENVRDKANGLVGTATGVSFLVTSVISGLLVAAGGMYYCCCWPSACSHWPCCTSPRWASRRTGRHGWSATQAVPVSTCGEPSGW